MQTSIIFMLVFFVSICLVSNETYPYCQRGICAIKAWLRKSFALFLVMCSSVFICSWLCLSHNLGGWFYFD